MISGARAFPLSSSPLGAECGQSIPLHIADLMEQVVVYNPTDVGAAGFLYG